MSNNVQVGVVMGSDSDYEAMKACVKQLEAFGISFEVRIISAHRTPAIADEYAASAAQRGLKVIIAAAGMSAALSGVLAARTTLPVIGVPMPAGTLGGVDAALSTMQMPPGIPVGCMAIGGALNAAIYAAQIIALGDKDLRARLEQFKQEQTGKVIQKDNNLKAGI
ncbi:MAG: 5-(carboxyamino)imidazole ribonucleotide mutase [Planctomycetes bacterium]|jgi:5-(carboxyamino)imidazole ribonucleotide mutase|nr:5-(carboxyamino)imidazole ribonucleotide mutase [Planctomycetota bacterium]